MSFCSKCGNQLEAGARFCSICGTPVAEQAPQAPQQPVYTAPQQPVYTAPQQPVYTAPQQPVYTAPQQPAYNAPAYPAVPEEPTVSVGTKVSGFVGMGLAIFGLFMAFIGICNMLPYMGTTSYYNDGYAFGLAIGFSIFSLPLGIVGRILCSKSVKAGNTSKACSIGSGMGLASIILSAVMLFLGFVSAASVL